MGWMILLAAGMWVLQLLLGLWQFGRFNKHLKELRCYGRVACGKAKGGFRAGAVALICINERAEIVHAETMVGRTVFASFQELPVLKGKFLPAIVERDCDGLGKQVTAAVLNARQDYENYQELRQEQEKEESAALAE